MGATVEDGDANKARVTFSVPSQGINGSVGLQSCTATDFAVVVAGSGRTSTGCSITGINRVDVTFNGSAVTNGQAVTVVYEKRTAKFLSRPASLRNIATFITARRSKRYDFKELGDQRLY